MSNVFYTGTIVRSRTAMPIGGALLEGERDRTAAHGWFATPSTFGPGADLPSVTGVVRPHTWSPPS